MNKNIPLQGQLSLFDPINIMNITDELNIDYQKFYLNNGIKCILYPRHEIHSVTVQANIKLGSLDEDQSTNGLAHFIEHVVHEATEELPTWEDVENFKTKYSASTNAYTSLDHTQFYGTFPYQYAKEAIYYFSQIITKPLFKKEDVEKERTIIIDELKGYEDDTDFHIVQNIKNHRFINAHTSFSYDIIGTTQLLENYSVDSLKQFWSRFYVPSNMEIYVLGNFDVDAMKGYLEKYFGWMQKAEKPIHNYKDEYPNYSEFNVSAKKKLDLDKYYLTVTFPGLDFKNNSLEERYKVSFLLALTASSSYMQSILWKRLRQELALVYGVFAWSYDMFSRDIIGIGTSFESEHLETVLTEYYNGIKLINSGKFSDNVFESKKRKTIDTQLMQLDKPENALNWISSYEDEVEEHGVGMMISDYLRFVQNLKFEDIVEVGKDIYDLNKINIGVVSKDDEEFVIGRLGEIWAGVAK